MVDTFSDARLGKVGKACRAEKRHALIHCRQKEVFHPALLNQNPQQGM